MNNLTIVALALIVFFFTLIASTFIGALAGAAVSVVFSETSVKLLEHFNMQQFTL